MNQESIDDIYKQNSEEVFADFIIKEDYLKSDKKQKDDFFTDDYDIITSDSIESVDKEEEKYVILEKVKDDDVFTEKDWENLIKDQLISYSDIYEKLRRSLISGIPDQL